MRNLFAVTGAVAAFLSAGVMIAGAWGTPSASRPAAVAVTYVTVTMSEYKLVLTRKTVPHGVIVFKLRNRGEINHRFKILGKTSVVVTPGANKTLRVTIANPGVYKYICPMPGHAMAGQRGKLTVT